MNEPEYSGNQSDWQSASTIIRHVMYDFRKVVAEGASSILYKRGDRKFLVFTKVKVIKNLDIQK